MDSCDVLIVGAGPAGSSCAWGLRSSGLDVLIVDKSSPKRSAACAMVSGLMTASIALVSPLTKGDKRGQVSDRAKVRSM